MYLKPQESLGVALYQANITEGTTVKQTTIDSEALDGTTTPIPPHDHSANYDSTKLLIIFMAIVFAVLLLFILIYYYCVKGMKSSTIARQAHKSTSGSITDEKARNIFAHPERHLAVDQSQRASPSPSSVEDAGQVNQPNQQQQQQQQPNQQQSASQATGGSSSGMPTGGVSPAQITAASAPASAAAANPTTGSSAPTERSGMSAASGVPGDPIHSRTPSTNTMTESQVAAAAATLSTSESMGGSQAHKSGHQHSGGRKSTAGQLARSPVKSKLNAPASKAQAPAQAPQQQQQQQQQQHSAGMRKSPQKVADAGGRANSGGGSSNNSSALAAAAAKKSKTKSGSGKMTIVGTLANLRDTLKDTKIGAHH